MMKHGLHKVKFIKRASCET